MQELWQLLTRHHPGLEEVEVVGTVAQVLGCDPVQSQRGKPEQRRLRGKKTPPWLDYTEIIRGLWGIRGRAGRVQYSGAGDASTQKGVSADVNINQYRSKPLETLLPRHISTTAPQTSQSFIFHFKVTKFKRRMTKRSSKGSGQ